MILASVITYELTRRVGAVEAELEFSRQCSAIADDPSHLPAARTLRKFRKLADVAKLHDAGGTSIGKCRSRAFSVAHHAITHGQPLDYWLSVDDDLELSDETVSHLHGSLDPDVPQIVLVPYLMRQNRTVVAVSFDPTNKLERVTKTGARLRRAIYGGFGAVAVTRAAVLQIADRWRAELAYTEEDGSPRIGVFCEFIAAGKWWGEDFAFFARVPKSVRVEALCTGVTNHAGKKLRLDTLESLPSVRVPPSLEEYFSPKEAETQPG